MNFDECAKEIFSFARTKGYKITRLEIEKLNDANSEDSKCEKKEVGE